MSGGGLSGPLAHLRGTTCVDIFPHVGSMPLGTGLALPHTVLWGRARAGRSLLAARRASDEATVMAPAMEPCPGAIPLQPRRLEIASDVLSAVKAQAVAEKVQLKARESLL
ncbi:hypothetical protein AAFF_G00332330 [Aldrovandia affinis]|uniref:Uncharacterized protein n=1 Tax=Aldrovandia affinis TaxID=143900 RepID=A0AAD7WPP3_9TELE|nr:hypothetical protein AAFF_G00332330 [Aldrovandia affinis]